MTSPAPLVYVEHILAAKRPEDLFNPDLYDGTNAHDAMVMVKSTYHELSKLVHPDTHGGEEVFTEAFQRLTVLYEQALAAIERGTFGKTPGAGVVTIKTADHTYEIVESLWQGNHCDLFRATTEGDVPAFVKVARQPKNNDLVLNEARILKKLWDWESAEQVVAEPADFAPFLPELIETFGFSDTPSIVRQALTLVDDGQEWVSLEQVHAAYPGGIDPKDFAWMFKRTLFVLAYAHSLGIVHGAVLPEHIVIQPETHGVKLIDWSYAVDNGQIISAIVSAKKDWYAPEILAKEVPGPESDTFMAARAMVEVLGGNPLAPMTENLKHVPPQIVGYLRSLLLSDRNARPADTVKLFADFDQRLVRWWGPRKFHHFSLPTKE